MSILNHTLCTLINDDHSYRAITGVINFSWSRAICVKNLLALIPSVLTIVFRRCFANFITLELQCG